MAPFLFHFIFIWTCAKALHLVFLPLSSPIHVLCLTLWLTQELVMVVCGCSGGGEGFKLVRVDPQAQNAIYVIVAWGQDWAPAVPLVLLPGRMPGAAE